MISYEIKRILENEGIEAAIKRIADELDDIFESIKNFGDSDDKE